MTMLHNKFWQAFFALAPILMLVLFFIGYFVFLFSLFSSLPELETTEGLPPSEFFGSLGFFLLMVFLAVLISFGSLVFYIVHAVQNPNLKENNLLLVWILLFVFVNGIGQLIYWVVEIVNKRESKLPTP